MHWLYALVVLATLLGLRYYIGLSNPKLSEGAASQFNFLKWAANVVRRGQLVPESDLEQQHIVVPAAVGTAAPTDITRASPQNERGTDFQGRHLYHQQQVVGGGGSAPTRSS